MGLLALAISGCGDDGGGDDQPTAGLIVGQQAQDGELGDRLVVVDPDRPDHEEIDLADVGRGTPAGRGTAFYETPTDLYLVDAEAGEAHDLGVDLTDADPGYSLGVVQGGGRRFTVLLSPTGAAATLVDLEEATATALGLGDATLYYSAELTPDESRALVNTDDGAWLVPTDDPGDPERLADGAGQLVDDGTGVLLRTPDGILVQDLDSGDGVELGSTGIDGVLAVGSRVVAVQGDEAVLVEPGSPDVLASAPYSGRGAAPLVAGTSILLPGPGGRWTLMDADAATTTPLDELTGMVPAFSGRPPTRWVPFSDSAELGGRRVVAVDAADGSVATVLDLPRGQQVVGFPDVADQGPNALLAVDRPEGTTLLVADLETGELVELGVRLQGAALSPDGERVAWSGGDDPDNPSLLVADVEDPTSADVLADGVALPLWLE